MQSNFLTTKPAIFLILTLSGWVACPAYHENPSVFLGGMPGVTGLKICFMWKMNRQYGNFFNDAK